MEFAAALELPNKYTGYAYLLDRENRVRWRGSGQSQDGEVDTLIQCVEQLRAEQQQAGGQGGGSKKKGIN
jgi:hypothetical protein